LGPSVNLANTSAVDISRFFVTEGAFLAAPAELVLLLSPLEPRQSMHCFGVQPGYLSRTSCRKSKDLPQVSQLNNRLPDLLEDGNELG